MVIHRSGLNCVALYVDGDEIASYGWEEIDEEQARMLAEDALAGLGLRPRDLMKIEAFTGYDGVMIFAQIQSSDSYETNFFRFETADDLLALAKSASFRTPLMSTLYLYDGCYILSVSGTGRSLTEWLIHLSEYAHRLQCTEDFEHFLAEHGELIVKQYALRVLCGQRTT